MGDMIFIDLGSNMCMDLVSEELEKAEKTPFQSFFVDGDITQVLRLQYKNVLLYSREYTRVTSSNSFSIIFVNGSTLTTGQILYFLDVTFVNDTVSHAFAVVEPYQSENFMHQPHLFKCTYSGLPIVIPVESIEQKSVCVSYGDEFYLAKFPCQALQYVS